MPASVEIIPIPLGSQRVQTIGNNDPEDLNDFPVLFLFSENVNLTESGIMVSAGATLVSLEGKNSVWMGWVRPPQTAGVVTVTVNANAVAQGNPETSKDIRGSTSFPDVDAETPTLLFNHNLSYRFNQALGVLRVEGRGLGITCSPDRIIISSSGYTIPRKTGGRSYIDFFTYDGVHQPAETITQSHLNSRSFLNIDFINGDLLLTTHPFSQPYTYRRFHLKTQEYSPVGQGGNLHTRLGYTLVGSSSIRTQPYDLDTGATTHTVDARTTRPAAHQNDLLYILGGKLIEITDEDEFEVIRDLNIARTIGGRNVKDIAIYRDALYLSGETSVYTLDIKKYRPVAKHTKSTIYPVFIEEGGTLDLKQFSPDAERIVFDVGYDKHPQLSINANSELVAGSGAQTCLVKLKAINRIDATETGSFQFYLIVRPAAGPVWREVSQLTMPSGSSYDLFPLVPNADTIVFRTDRTQPTGSRLSNGMFKIGTVGGVAEFTAKKGTRSSHIAIAIDVIQNNASDRSEVSGYRVEIAGIDVTADVLAFPSVSETLDPVVINEYRVNEAAITLRNEAGKYNSDLAGNFWETNGLNAGGFQNSVKIYLQYVDGSENLHFSGIINESFEPLKDATFKLNCADISSRLRKALAENFGTLEKWDALRKQSDEDSYEGVYVPERSLVPMQVGTGEARSHRTDLDISRLELPSEGPAAENTGYMTPTDFKTAGGFLPENPLLGFMTQHRSEDVRFLINQLAINKEVYNTEIDIPGVEVEDPFLLNRGSVAFSVEQTRTTRLPVDWVVGVESGLQTPPTLLILLSNPEGHIADLLVQYDINSDSYRVLHTFDKGVSVHRIARRNATNYYILTSKKILQDRSVRQESPCPTDATGYAYDAVAAGSEIRIFHYNSGLQTPLTEHVAEDNTFPPQLGRHYWVGFENTLYIDEFEGIRPDDRGTFKWQGSHLYYRYAMDFEFGVARVNASGTTTKQIQNATTPENNAFFCVNSGVPDRVFVFPKNTQHAETPSNAIIFSLPSNLTSPTGMTIDGNDLYITDSSGDEVFVVPADTADGQTAVASRRFNLPATLTTPFSMVISGNDLYVADSSGDEVFVVPADTADGQTAVASRRFNLPNNLDSPRGMAIAGNDLYIADDSGDEVFVVPADTADGQTASVSRRFNLPSAISSPQGMSLNANDLCIVDSTDDDLYIIPADTANNATATITRQFNLPSGLSFPTGLALGQRVLSSPVAYQNHLNFAFDVTSTGTVYFAHALGSSVDSSLIIKQKVSGGTETTVLSDNKGLTELTDLDDAGGTYLGVHECLFHNNYLYLLCAIGRVDVDDSTNPPTTSRSRTKAAGMVLYRCDVTAGSPSLTVLDKWDFVHQAGCNLTVHDGNVYYVEQPRAATVFKPINPDLDGYWTDESETETMGYNVVEESLGALKKINSSGEVEHLGNVWFTDRPYNVFPTRMLSIDGDLHLCAGYGNLDELLRYNSLASEADNMVHIVYGRKLHYVLPRFAPNGTSIYAALAALAKSVNATLSFEKNVIMISDRRPYRAVTDGATGTGTGDLSFSDTNKAFPSSGYLLIGKEILRYSGITGGAFTGVQRGVLGSPIENHADDSEVLYLDNIIQTEKLGSPYKASTLQSDTNRIFNVIRDSAGVAEVRDEASIALYGERPYTLELGLTRHEKAWIEEIFKSYLEELKDLQQIVNIQVIPDDSLRLGQIVPFFYKDLIRAMRIVSVRYERRTTHIKGRTLS